MSRALPSAVEKSRFVAAMFGRIARRYDLMNTLMTLGRDAGWRRAAARATRPPRGGLGLDVGTGTGKLALALAEAMGDGRVVGVDFAEPMLRAGRPALEARPAGRRVTFAAADGQALPFAADTFDCVVSAFVVRNLSDPALGLREQVHVLRPGGRLAILEITPGPPHAWRPLFRLYFRRVVPVAGRLIAGDAAAYTYLPESAAAFVEPDDLAALLRDAGLVAVTSHRLGLGSVAIIAGTKPG